MRTVARLDHQDIFFETVTAPGPNVTDGLLARRVPRKRTVPPAKAVMSPTVPNVVLVDSASPNSGKLPFLLLRNP
jgi:hypothetical protein